MLEAVFFDLDGTLADTAPDLAGALNRVRVEEGHAALPLDLLRPVVSQGVRGLLRVGFGLMPEDEAYRDLQERVLNHYERDICKETRLFDGIPELLAQLEAQGIRWGVITNKRSRFTLPLLSELNLDKRACCIVSGDSTTAIKPSPEPIYLACRLAAVTPANCWYVGDDRRDVEAAHAAGMPAAAAAYGYLGENPIIADWQPDAVIDHPSELLTLLRDLGMPSAVR